MKGIIHHSLGIPYWVFPIGYSLLVLVSIFFYYVRGPREHKNRSYELAEGAIMLNGPPSLRRRGTRWHAQGPQNARKHVRVITRVAHCAFCHTELELDCKQ